MHRHDHDRPASLLSLSSTYNSNTDDHHHDHHHDDNHKQPLPLSAFQPSRQSSVASDHSCGGMSDDEMRGLWRCMLQLQDRYCCYKSTRMDLALSAGDEDGEFMPNRFIIDVLNDSIIELPEQGWEMLEQHLNYAGMHS